MATYQFITIVGSILGIGLALAVLIMRITARLDADRRATDTRTDADRRAAETRSDRYLAEAAARSDRYLAEAAADRRAMQESIDAFRTEMSTFRTEMHRLAERQVRVEATAAD